MNGLGMGTVIADIARERIRQDGIWGEQNHPDATGPHVDRLWLSPWGMSTLALRARDRCKSNGPAEDNWLDILLEEVFEALAEDEPEKLRAELIQAAAVCAAWVEAIDRRRRAAAWDAVATRATAPDDSQWEAITDGR